MGKILPDRELKKLLGSVILNSDESTICPNTIVLRLGEKIQFESTRENKLLSIEQPYLKIKPGETVYLTSFERIDFSKETVQKLFANRALFGTLYPTTTMSREGLSFPTTKIDSGFKGILNWTVRNNSSKDATFQLRERLYALNIYLLDEDETPEKYYGDGHNHRYQNSDGIISSSRLIPADISENQIIESDIEKLDANKKLKEAGYPFNFIGNELNKLEESQKHLKKQIKGLEKSIPDKVSSALNTKFSISFGIFLTLIGLIWTMYDKIAKFLPVFLLVLGLSGIILYFVFRKRKA